MVDASVTVEQPSDEALVTQVIDGDTEAFGMLVRRYEQKLLRYGRRFMSGREDIEDIVQEAFLRAYQNLRSFDRSRRFSPWIYRIAHNAFINEMRRATRHPTVEFNADILLPHRMQDSPENDHDRAVMREFLRTGLDRLDKKYREPLILYYFEEMSYAEVSDILRIPVSTVGVRINRGRAALRKILNTNAPSV